MIRHPTPLQHNPHCRSPTCRAQAHCWHQQAPRHSCLRVSAGRFVHVLPLITGLMPGYLLQRLQPIRPYYLQVVVERLPLG